MTAQETDLAFVATLRDEATRVARSVRSELTALAGTTAAVEIPLQVRDEATRGLGEVDTQLKGVGEQAAAVSREVRAAGASMGSTFVDAAGRIRNADGTFASAAGSAFGGSKVQGEARKSGGRFGEIFGKSALGPLRAYGEAAAAFFAIDKINEFVRGSVEAAREVQRAQALTAQVIKTTGGAAGVTADQVGKMSEALSLATGVDRAQIQTGARLLLTFRSVRNEIGAGNDIYSQAVKLSNDLAVSMGESNQSAAIQLGKALNDPTRGLSMLNRVGIQFNATQTEQIQKMQKSGNLLGAQKIILGEVTKEFGGSARASATSASLLHAKISQLREEFGSALFGALGKVEGALAGKLLPLLDKLPGEIASGLHAAQSFVREVGPGFLDVAHAAGSLIGAAVDVERMLWPIQRITLGALVIAFRVVAAGARDVAGAIHTVTTFLRNSEVAASALEAVLVVLAARQMLALAASIGKVVATNLDGFLVGVALKAAQAKAAFENAKGGVAGLAAGMKALNVNPVILALTAIATVAAISWNRDKKATEEAKASADAYVQSLGATKSSLASVQNAIGGLSLPNIAAQIRVDAGGNGAKAIAEYGDLLRSRQALVEQAARMRATESSVAGSLHTSTSAVERLATAYNIDLTGPLPEVTARIKAAAKAVELTHHPNAQAAADLAKLGDKASSTSDDVQLLTDSLNLLAGDSITAHQGITAFHNDIAQLDKALKASKNVIGEHGQAARDSADALDAAAQQALNNAEAEAKLKNGTAKARATLDAEINTLQKHAGSSAYAQTEINRLQNALAKIPGAADAAGSALKRNADQSKGAGRTFDQGFATGIDDGQYLSNAAAVRLGKAAYSSVRQSIVSHSPSRLMHEVGLDEFAKGLALGIDDGSGMVTSAAAKVGDAAGQEVGKAGLKIIGSLITSFASNRQNLRRVTAGLAHDLLVSVRGGPKAVNKETDSIIKTVRSQTTTLTNELKSQAKTLRGHIHTVKGQLKTLDKKESTDSQIKNAKDRAAALAADAKARHGYNKDLTKTQTELKILDRERRDLNANERAAVKEIKDNTDRLDKIATRRAAVAAKLAKARDNLSALVSEQADLRSTITSGFASFGNVTSIATVNDAPVTAGFIVQGLQQRLAAVRSYAANIRTLIRRHLNRATLLDILHEGPDQGGAYAAALVAATDQQISAVNDAQSQIGTIGDSLAKTVGSDFYDAGIKAAEGVVEGLKSRQDDLDRTARHLGKAIVKAMRDELGIKSPSRAGLAIGANVPRAVASGIDAHSARAEAAAAKMAARVAVASRVELGNPRAAQLGPVVVQRAATQTVEIRHRVAFDQPEVASKLSAADVADVIARDPRSARRLEQILKPQRKISASTILTATGANG